MYISEIIELLHAKLSSLHLFEDSAFDRLCTDTRHLKVGDLFIALKGDNFDGHNFVEKAKELGAVAALVERHVSGVDIVQILVPDTVLALGKLSAWKRQQFSAPILAVTGSCGKTTTKEMLATILRQNNHILSSIKSFNNHIGVPLTLWQLSDAHRFAVLEVGANHHGEISYLTDIIKPDVAIITNAAPVHLEGFGDVDGVARAKGEIFEGVNENGFVILNADDQYCDYWRDLASGKNIITFGMQNYADVSATDIIFDENGTSNFILHTPHGDIRVALPLLGQHNIMNALAATSGALAIETPLYQIKLGLESVVPVCRRLESFKGYADARIIDDTYNANPRAVEVTLEIMERQQGEKILVLGDMLELGEDAVVWHEKVGKIAREKSINAVYTYGDYGKAVVKAFGDGGYAFSDKQELVVALKKNLNPNCVVLVKGSFGMGMDEIVKSLKT